MIRNGWWTRRHLRTGGIPLVGFLMLTVTLGAQVRFDPQGKRDPFVTLLKKEKVEDVAQILPPPPLEKRPPGLAGLLISEISVTGIASSSETRMAIVAGIDGMTYFAYEGTKLFDSHVESITTQEVRFVHEQVDTRGKKRISKVTKRIQTEE